MGETILTGFVGAVIALYLNYYYDLHKEKKRMYEYNKTIITLIEKRFIPKYKHINYDYLNLYKIITKESKKAKPLYNLLINNYLLDENDLRTYFSTDDIIKIFNNTNNVNYNSILNIENNIYTIKRFSPEILAQKYIDELDNADNKDIEDICIKYKEDFTKYASFCKSTIKRYEEILEDLNKISFQS